MRSKINVSVRPNSVAMRTLVSSHSSIEEACRVIERRLDCDVVLSLGRQSAGCSYNHAVVIAAAVCSHLTST